VTTPQVARAEAWDARIDEPVPDPETREQKRAVASGEPAERRPAWDAPVTVVAPGPTRGRGKPRWDALTIVPTPVEEDEDEVPERPVLAPGVRLAGEMQGTAFQTSQWLIDRNGRFLQVSEPLYRVAEQIDGLRTLEEIAAAVSEATGWIVTPEHVREIIRLKFLPAGILLDVDDLPVLLPAASARSPLQVNMRMKAMGPRVIDPITGVLQWLFSPFALVPLLALVIAMEYWVLAVHGVHAGFKQVIFTPALVLAVAPIMILSGLVHELGHASGLRYGGGRARRIGAGLYLIWPAFFTDTTDSYRLSRAGRVRTDLGGFYFHLLFAVGVVAAYFFTGAEFLLFIVVLINLEILQQLLFPFVRLDGYWLLADLTGVPDFFSQTGPFLRRVFRRGAADTRLPDLKTWPARVFGVYLLVTIPLLGFMLYMTVKTVPGLTSMTWNSIVTQGHNFRIAQARGAGFDMVAAIAQMLVLALPLLATGGMLLITATWLASKAWRRLRTR
jgi:putative peptide zinc metalloprotease protein